MVLEKILRTKREEIKRLRRILTPAYVEKSFLKSGKKNQNFSKALTSSSAPRLICEMKKASPSEGVIRPNFEPFSILRAFERGGASAISILTDITYFKGSPGLIPALKPQTVLPILRKDFLIDDIQLYESKLLGADAVLLIVAALSKQKLKSLIRLATQLSLEVLVEIHEELELEAALESGAKIIGVNNRSLKTLKTNVGYAEKSLAQIPRGILKVVESGIAHPADLTRYQPYGVHAFLVGTTLMRAKNITSEIQKLKKSYAHD